MVGPFGADPVMTLRRAHCASASFLLLAACQNAVTLPQGDLFAPLLADPKEPQFFTHVRSVRPEGDDRVTLGAVGFGETFGLYRDAKGGGGAADGEGGDGWQLNLAGGLFAQFNLDAASSDLINADYVIGMPITWRRGPHALRARVYHQSSHLGDEFLLGPNPPARQNLSYESCEAIYSRQNAAWRWYAGGEYLFRREPEELEPLGMHGGVEYRSAAPLFAGARLVAGLDLKSWDQHDWEPSVAVVAGFEFESAALNGRRIRALFEAYDGFTPYGQFYEEEISYFGFGLTFAF